MNLVYAAPFACTVRLSSYKQALKTAIRNNLRISLVVQN